MFRNVIKIPLGQSKRKNQPTVITTTPTQRAVQFQQKKKIVHHLPGFFLNFYADPEQLIPDPETR